MSMIEGLFEVIFKEVLDVELVFLFFKMIYVEVMFKYGLDKLDIRFGYELIDIFDVVCNCGFKVFVDVI